MSARRRLRIAYIVPGHNLLATAGPTRNVLSLAKELARHADVTVAFRRVLEGPVPAGIEAVPIEPGVPRNAGGGATDDAAVRGVGYGEFFFYLRSIRRFLRAHEGRFDVVLEKSWLLSGYVSGLCRRRGVPGVLVENYYPPVPLEGGLAKRIRHRVARRIAGRYARGAAVVIAETEELKETLAERWSIRPEKIEVVGLGVDRALFRPRSREEARWTLGIDPERTVLLYIGVLDRTHDLRPLLEALRSTPEIDVEAHVVGGGRLAGDLDRIGAACGGRVRFHGVVPHGEVPAYIAAADLCLAPYDSASFAGGKIGYSTLKIPEYLASGRPVASVPYGHIRTLIRPGVDGFLLENDAESWARFLRSGLPARARLGEMGEAAARSEAFHSWEETARRYAEICERARGAVRPGP